MLADDVAITDATWYAELGDPYVKAIAPQFPEDFSTTLVRALCLDASTFPPVGRSLRTADLLAVAAGRGLAATVEELNDALARLRDRGILERITGSTRHLYSLPAYAVEPYISGTNVNGVQAQAGVPASLQVVSGPQGLPGTSGAQGSTGPPGPTGDQGPAGNATLSDVTPQAVGTASPGGSTDASRGDHVHAHGAQPLGDGTAHATVTDLVAGFMSVAEHLKLSLFGPASTYLLRDGSVAMTGNLDVGGHDVTNVGNVDGVDVSAHVALTSGAHGISAFGATLVDDADAAAARTTLGVAANGVITASGITMSTARLLGRTSASTGPVEEISVGSTMSLAALALGVANLGIGTGQLADNAVTDAKLRQGAARTLIGRSANSAGNVADIAGGGAGTVMADNGIVVAFLSIDLSYIGDQVLLDMDWTAQSTSDFRAGGAAPTGWVYENAGATVCDVAGITNGQGVNFDAASGASGSTTFTVGSTTCFKVYYPLTSVVGFDPLGLYVVESYFSVLTLGTTANRVSCGLWSPTNLRLVAATRHNNSGTQEVGMVHASTVTTSSVSNTYNTIALRVDSPTAASLGGTYAAAFPIYPFVSHAVSFGATPTVVPYVAPDTGRIVVAFSTGETGGAMVARLARTRLRRIR